MASQSSELRSSRGRPAKPYDTTPPCLIRAMGGRPTIANHPSALAHDEETACCNIPNSFLDGSRGRAYATR